MKKGKILMLVGTAIIGLGLLVMLSEWILTNPIEHYKSSRIPIGLVLNSIGCLLLTIASIVDSKQKRTNESE